MNGVLQSGNQRRRVRRSRRGATTVEAAVVLPLFFLLLMGAYEFGRLGSLRGDITSVAYDAARFATREGATRQETIDFAQEQFSKLGVQGAAISVEPAPEAAMEDVTVLVSLPIGKYGWITPAIAKHQQIASSVTLRVETAASPNANGVRDALTSMMSGLTSTTSALKTGS